MTKRPKVWLSHRYGHVPENLWRAQRWLRWLQLRERQCFPGLHIRVIAPWIEWAYADLFKAETDALEACKREISECYGLIAISGPDMRLSPGQRVEVEHAAKLRRRPKVGVWMFKADFDPGTWKMDPWPPRYLYAPGESFLWVEV